MRELGKTGIEVSAVGLGTWAIGGGPWWGERDEAQSIKAIQAAVDAGITLVDTAPVYGFGTSEEIVGKAIRDRRDKVILATKGGLWWDDDQGAPFFELEGKRVKRCLRPETLVLEVEQSLRRLGTDYIDLYQTHWQAMEQDPTPIEDTMACLLKLKDQGKIRAIGASNASPDHVNAYLASGPLASIQEKYSILDRKLEKHSVPHCVENDVSILAYSPLEQGLLTGKIGMDTTFAPGSYRNNIVWFAPHNRERVLDMLKGWEPFTQKYSCTMAQLVIAWTAQQRGITVVLCGASKASQAQENAAAGAIEIQEKDLTHMRSDVRELGVPL